MKRKIKTFLLSLLRPKTFREMTDLQMALFPNGELQADNYEQIILYTGLIARLDNTLADFDPDSNIGY